MLFHVCLPWLCACTLPFQVSCCSLFTPSGWLLLLAFCIVSPVSTHTTCFLFSSPIHDLRPRSSVRFWRFLRPSGIAYPLSPRASPASCSRALRSCCFYLLTLFLNITPPFTPLPLTGGDAPSARAVWVALSPWSANLYRRAVHVRRLLEVSSRARGCSRLSCCVCCVRVFSCLFRPSRAAFCLPGPLCSLRG